jgi:hypothetical protein
MATLKPWDRPKYCKKMGCRWLQWVNLDGPALGNPTPYDAVCILAAMVSNGYNVPHRKTGYPTDRIIYMKFCPKRELRKEQKKWKEGRVC